MEGKFLSRRSAGDEVPALLREQVSDGRNQLHVLPDADAEADRRLARASAAAVPIHAEGAETHYARSPAARRRCGRIAAGIRHSGRGTRAAAGGVVVSAAAQFQEGSRGAQRVPGAAAAKDDGGLRVSKRVVV